MTFQFLDAKPKPDKFWAAVAVELSFVQLVGDDKLEGKAESGYDKRPAAKINENGGLGRRNFRGTQAPA